MGFGIYRAGELMRFDVMHVSARKQVQSVPLPLRLSVGVKYVAAGDGHVVALTTEQEVYEWGYREAMKPEALKLAGNTNIVDPNNPLKNYTKDCGGGCLYSIYADPGEHLDAHAANP